MTNLINTCFILQYVYYNPLHVSSFICSSSGGWIVLMQRLVSSLSVSGGSVHRLRGNCCYLSTCAPDGHLLRVTIPDVASIQFILLMMSIWCSKHVEDYNKRIVKWSKCVSFWSLSKSINFSLKPWSEGSIWWNQTCCRALSLNP